MVDVVVGDRSWGVRACGDAASVASAMNIVVVVVVVVVVVKEESRCEESTNVKAPNDVARGTTYD